MKYVFETGVSAMIYIPSFVKIGSGIQTLMEEGIYRHKAQAHTQIHTTINLQDYCYFQTIFLSLFKKISFSLIAPVLRGPR
jgi:hypothetical protein